MLQDAWQETSGSWCQVPVAVCLVDNSGLGVGCHHLLDSGTMPDALGATSEELHLGKPHTAHQAGAAVPQQLAVTGWDDTDGARADAISQSAESAMA